MPALAANGRSERPRAKSSRKWMLGPMPRKVSRIVIRSVASSVDFEAAKD